jgi:nucleoside 2-deoxyribosyltransferase
VKYLVYLAGPIRGLDYAGATDWRDEVRRRMPPHIECASPMRNKEFLKSEKVIDEVARGYTHPLATRHGITARDRFDVQRCDLMLVNFVGAERISTGTCVEFGWADSLRKPIVMAMEPGNVHEHPILLDVAGFIVPTLEEAIEIAIAILGPSRLLEHP